MKTAIPRRTSLPNQPAILTALLLGSLAIVGTSRPAQASIIVHNSDFIADSSRTHFNGFESIPIFNTSFYEGEIPYTEDSITVQQINGDEGYNIWATWTFEDGFEGSHGWYPNGGDNGYTQLSLASGGRL